MYLIALRGGRTGRCQPGSRCQQETPGRRQKDPVRIGYGRVRTGDRIQVPSGSWMLVASRTGGWAWIPVSRSFPLAGPRAPPSKR